MENGQLQIVNVFEEKLAKWRNLADGINNDDFKVMQYAIMTLLYKKGFIDGSLIEDYNMYRLVDTYFQDINEYIGLQGLCLQIDNTAKLIWVELLPEFELCSPFVQRFMSANQLILLSVLLRRFATNNSSKDITGVNINGVLVSEKDIVTDMLVYMKNADDNAKRYKEAIGAINYFCTELGLLRLIWNNNANSMDNSASKIYRISPYIGMKFNVLEMDKLIESVKTAFMVDTDDNATDTEDTAVVEDNEEEEADE